MITLNISAIDGQSLKSEVRAVVQRWNHAFVAAIAMVRNIRIECPEAILCHDIQIGMTMTTKVRFVHETDLEPNGCEWPKCICPVPDFAFSMHNRVHYCLKLTEAIENGTLIARQYPL